MNHMSEVARMLGIEIGEEFKVEIDKHSGNLKYKLTETHFECFTRGRWYASSSTLVCLLNGQAKVVKIPKPILDDVEKEYLGCIIRPFRDKVKYILKCCNEFNEYEWIRININEDGNIDFPKFKKNTMYKGMETYKNYTLEELGL